jgi:hypothetical protein
MKIMACMWWDSILLGNKHDLKRISFVSPCFDVKYYISCTEVVHITLNDIVSVNIN